MLSYCEFPAGDRLSEGRPRLVPQIFLLHHPRARTEMLELNSINGTEQARPSIGRRTGRPPLLESPSTSNPSQIRLFICMSRAFIREDVDPPERSGRLRSASGLPPGATNY